MQTRPEVVHKIHALAFDAIAAPTLPEDITPQEQAEGLISLVVAILAEESSPEGIAAQCAALAEKRKNDRLLKVN